MKKINDQERTIFCRENKQRYEVEIIDYHK